MVYQHCDDMSVVPKELFCTVVSMNPSDKTVQGVRCFDGSNLQNIVLIPKSRKYVDDLSQKKAQRKQASENRKKQREAELRKNKCGIYGLRKTPSQKVIPCPKGMTEYKYYYDDRCRAIKDSQSKNILTKAKHLPMFICIPNHMKPVMKSHGIVLTTPKEQEALEKNWQKTKK